MESHQLSQVISLGDSVVLESVSAVTLTRRRKYTFLNPVGRNAVLLICFYLIGFGFTSDK